MNSYSNCGIQKKWIKIVQPSGLFLVSGLFMHMHWSITCVFLSFSLSSGKDQVYPGRGGRWPPTSSAFHRAGRAAVCGRAGDGVEGDRQVSHKAECVFFVFFKVNQACDLSPPPPHFYLLCSLTMNNGTWGYYSQSGITLRMTMFEELFYI